MSRGCRLFVGVETEVVEAAVDALETAAKCNTKLLPAKVDAVWDDMLEDSALAGVLTCVIKHVDQS